MILIKNIQIYYSGDSVKKISQGKFEVFTTKADAINKFMQLVGYCREELTYNRRLSFYCSKNVF